MAKQEEKKDTEGVKVGYTEKDQEKATKLYLDAKTKNNKQLMAKLQKEAKANQEAIKAASVKPKGKRVKMVATANLSGKYNLPYSEGQKFQIETNKSKELLKNKDAELDN